MRKNVQPSSLSAEPKHRRLWTVDRRCQNVESESFYERRKALQETNVIAIKPIFCYVRYNDDQQHGF